MNASLNTASVRLTVSALIITIASFAAAAPASAQIVQLCPGDVILSVNDQEICCSQDLVEAVRYSGQKMRFTVRDHHDGRIYTLSTTLRCHGIRFGVHSRDAWGGGARITSVARYSPATQCRIISITDADGGGAVCSGQ